MATDPVCGMQVDPTAAAEHRDTPSGPVHFCSAGCAAAFDAQHHHTATAGGTAPGEGTK
jgi:P-type Cu+ transporter